MGMLDQLLGQVLGGMAQGGGGRSAPGGLDLEALAGALRGGMGGGQAGHGGGLGGLGDALGGALGGRAGGSGMGGLGDALGGALGGRAGGGMPGAGGMGGALGGAGAAALLAALFQILQRNGGLGGLLSQFQQAGYGQQANSWVSTGQNAPIDANILSQVLGGGQLDSIAQQLGMPRGQVADEMASALPQVIDRMTPRGAVPDDGDDLVNRALEILQRGR